MTSPDHAAPIAIVTGADDGHLDYLVGLLRSLVLYNDRRLPVYVMDFGLSPEAVGRIRGIIADLTILPIAAIDRDIQEMRKAPGIPFIEGINYVLSTMRKLELAECRAFDFFLWLDADTLVLRPLSAWLPQPVPGRILAARNSRRTLDFQFKDRNPLVKTAMAEHLQRVTGFPARALNAFNSGVLLADAAYYAALVAWARETFLIPFGPYLMGDQAIINVAMSLRGEEALDFGPGINVSIAGPTGPLELLSQEVAGQPVLLPQIAGSVPAVFHYLYIKPHKHPDPGHPVVRLFHWWRGGSAGA